METYALEIEANRRRALYWALDGHVLRESWLRHKGDALWVRTTASVGGPFSIEWRFEVSVFAAVTPNGRAPDAVDVRFSLQIKDLSQDVILAELPDRWAAVARSQKLGNEGGVLFEAAYLDKRNPWSALTAHVTGSVDHYCELDGVYLELVPGYCDLACYHCLACGLEMPEMNGIAYSVPTPNGANSYACSSRCVDRYQESGMAPAPAIHTR